MLIGHVGMAFAASRTSPRTSLGTLIAVAILPDLIWPVLLLAGIESVKVVPGITAVTPLNFISYPYSHSLAAALAAGAVMGTAYWIFKRDRAAALTLFALVLSHYLLDFITHRPDLPIYPGGEARIGLGLWNSVGGTLIVEGAIFITGLWLYARGTRATTRAGRNGLWLLAGVLAGIYIASVFGPPPPDNPRAIAVVGLSQFFFVAWACWLSARRAAL